MSLHPDLSRRDFCKGLGLASLALLLDGCETLPRLILEDASGLAAGSDPSLLTPRQFEAKAGSVERARLNAAGGVEAPNTFLERFLSHSPRIQAAGRRGRTIGSVLYNPKPATIASAVKLQLTRGRGEPELLHNDLSEMAALQYAQHGAKSFAAVFPNTVSIIGDGIHKDRALLQLVVHGQLPSEKIVCTNQDLESLIGRQLTFARQMVNGIRCGNMAVPIKSSAIWIEAQNHRRIADDAISVALAGALIRLEVAGYEVRAITPADPGQRPTGWQEVSEAYRNFAVGQLIEAEQAVAQHVPLNALEQSAVSSALALYRPYLADIKKRLDWGHTCLKVYSEQKQDGRVDLLARPILLHIEGARKQL